MLNQNQRLLTFLALLVAAATVALSVLADDAEQQRQTREAQTHFRQTLSLTLEEAEHNLLHVATAYEGQKLVRNPQLSIDIARRLQLDGIRFLSKSLQGHIDAMLRTYTELDHVMATGAPPEVVEGTLGNYVANVIHILLISRVEWPHVAIPLTDKPALLDIARAVGQFDKVASKPLEHAKFRGYWFYYRTSDRRCNPARIRVDGKPLVCWIDDARHEGIETYSMLRCFDDLVRGASA